MNKELKNVGRFKLVKVYPEMSPADVRARMESTFCKSLEDKMNKIADELYELNLKGKVLASRGGLIQLELKAAILGGLIKEDIEKYDNLSKEINDES